MRARRGHGSRQRICSASMAAERPGSGPTTDRSPTDADRRMVVVTPTYAPDLELFADLHASVLRCFPDDVRHLVIVTQSDVAPFRRFAGPRCEVLGVGDVLPGSVRALPLTKLWVNLRRPVPPLRGWILQQLVKLAVAAQVDERVIVTADSDIVFNRPVTVETFAPGGQVRLFRLDDGVDSSLTRHVRWHAVSRSLLGLPAAPPPPLPDYVTALNSWDREVVGRMLARVEEVTGRGWLAAVGKELHFSECMLYGVYADEVEQAKGLVTTDDSLCHTYWGSEPLTVDGAAEMISSARPGDVAYMISAKSYTPVDVRRAAHARVFAA
jgi:Family of unknown function (DUF6492)